MLLLDKFLTVFQVIQDYVTPPNNTLSRHLMTYLSPQISHLVAARPMSVTMGNAIRQLKLDISGSDIDLPEQDVGFSLYQLYYHPLHGHAVAYRNMAMLWIGRELSLSRK